MSINTELEGTNPPSLEEFRLKVERGELEIWSCNPADIPPWTEEAKARLNIALAEIFGWEKDDETKEQDGCVTKGTI